MNFYSYVEDNPLRYTDPSGKCLEDWCIAEGGAALLGAGFEGIPEYVQQYNRTGNILLDQTGRELVFGKSLTGAVAGLESLYNPAFAASILGGGAFGTEQAFNPSNDPAVLGSRAGTSVGGGLTLNVGDTLTDEILNPDIKKLFPDLYKQLKLELGGGVDLATKYAQTVIGGSGSQAQTANLPQVSSSYSSYPNPVGGDSSYLPNTVVQNGVTYARNSSGLLNIATPGKTK